MSLGLSAIELARLQAALTTLLSPLDFERVGAWRRQARHTVQALLGADSSASLLPIPGEPAFDADDMQPFEFYNDWVSRNRLCQPRGLNVALPEGQDLAALYFYQNRQRPVIDRERQLMLLRTLLPAFTAGAYIALHVGARATVERLAGTMAEGVALFDERSRLAYRNTAWSELMTEDAEGARLDRECRQLGRVLLLLATPPGAMSRPSEVVSTGPRALQTRDAAYRLHGSLIGRGVLGAGPMALVLLERTTPGPRALDAMGACFHLTRRELTVARLLAEGRSNEGLARLLGVSIHTARRHVEHVLLKLGVHSRAAVGATLREGTSARRA